MELDFVKMSGAGNDFILIDDLERKICLSPEQVIRLCHRQRGIGADGIMLLHNDESGTADFTWDFFNSDGSRADMCGNGARCFARFIQDKTGRESEVSFLTGAGVIRAGFEGDWVSVNLTRPKDLVLNRQVEVGGERVVVHSVNTGVPHAIVVVEDVGAVNVQQMGAALRYHPEFAPAGTNVNFVQVLAPGQLRIRTYERGVEGETLACGTGVTAAALVMSRLAHWSSPVRVRVQGGEDLAVDFQGNGEGFEGVLLKGPAETVFEGRIVI